jgi:two-component system C4-dicarboxylate transport response regulator DctD
LRDADLPALQVPSCASPTEAVDILSSGEEFELVFCGLLESLEDKLFKRMRKDFPNIPVVVSSACHDLPLFLRALRNGAYDYLPRPFERAQLSSCVQRALEYRRLKLENL